MSSKRGTDVVGLATRDLRVLRAPDPAVATGLDVVVVVLADGLERDLSRCLQSLCEQTLDPERVGVLVLLDGVGLGGAPLGVPAAIEPRAWVVTANCGSAARARNTGLSFVDQHCPAARWVARMDWDDRFASPASLAAAVELAERTSCSWILGGNRVIGRDGSLLRLNPATEASLEEDAILERLRRMADGTAENELPSCNLLLAAHSGIRYTDTPSAEDHWLVARLLFESRDQGAILTEPLYADYTLDGEVTSSARRTGGHIRARRALHRAVATWKRVRELPGRVLGLGQEGIVRVQDGEVVKHFYPGVIDDEHVRWMASTLRPEMQPTPAPQFLADTSTGSWTASYPWVDTRPMTAVDGNAVREFVLRCLEARLVCGNVKRDNFRVLPRGELLYVDVGEWIVPMDVSVLLDSATRLYAIGALGWPDDELLRRPVDPELPEVWRRLPGFTEFFRACVAELARRSWAAAGSIGAEAELARCADVSLLIKVCGMDAETADRQVRHVVGQLSIPRRFAECVVLVDPHEGAFPRQHASGELARVVAILENLVVEGVVDRVLLAPSEPSAVRDTNLAWFGLDAAEPRSSDGVPVAAHVWGFDQIATRYVLQCDVDVLVGRRDRCHDYLAEMLDALRAEDVVCVAFNIPHDPASEHRQYAAPPGEYKPEVRCGLLDLERLRAWRPLPNRRTAAGLEHTWYRSLHARQRATGRRTLRGGSPSTFYVHPPNAWKSRREVMDRIRDLVAQGVVPSEQWGRWDLEADAATWTYPRRTEPVVVLARGRDVADTTLARFVAGLEMQDDQSFGVVVIDDASCARFQERLPGAFSQLGARISLVRRTSRRPTEADFTFVARSVCADPEQMVVLVDLRDALSDRTALRRIHELGHCGHDIVLAAAFRPSDPTRVPPLRSEWGRSDFATDPQGYLSSVRKSLLDRVLSDAGADDVESVRRDSTAIATALVAQSQQLAYVPEYFLWRELAPETGNETLP